MYAEGLREYSIAYPERSHAFIVPGYSEDETFTNPDLFREVTGALFNQLYRYYITMLNELVKTKGKTAAIDLIDLFTLIEIMDRLKAYALKVWQHREKVRIVDTLGGTTLELKDSPVKWISQRPVKEMAKFTNRARKGA